MTQAEMVEMVEMAERAVKTGNRKPPRKPIAKRRIQTGVCPFCGAQTEYNSRAGRMPLACGKGVCKSKARRQGRRPRSPDAYLTMGV